MYRRVVAALHAVAVVSIVQVAALVAVVCISALLMADLVCK